MRAYRQSLKVPPNAHRAVRKLFQQMNEEQIGILDLSERSGINKNTLKDWRTRTCPTVDNLEAALNVLGLCLTVGRLSNAAENRAAE